MTAFVLLTPTPPSELPRSQCYEENCNLRGNMRVTQIEDGDKKYRVTACASHAEGERQRIHIQNIESEVA